MQTEDKDYITVREAAELLGCSRHNIHYHISKGNIKNVKRLGDDYGKPLVLLYKPEILKLNCTIVQRGQPRKGQRLKR